MKKKIQILLVVALTLSPCALLPIVTTGCKSTPTAIVYRTTSSEKITVDAAMRSWGAYVAKFHPPVEQEASVRDAFGKYKLAELAILDAAIAYQNAAAEGDTEGQSATQITLNAAVAAAGAALADLTSLITSLGVQPQPTIP